MSQTFSEFRDVIGLWGSTKALAADLNTSTERTRKWDERNSIPAEWWGAILATPVARRAGLTAEHLVALVPEPVGARA